MAQITLTVNDVYLDRILEGIEGSVGRDRDPDTGDPIQANGPYIKGVLKNYVLGLVKKHENAKHKRDYLNTVVHLDGSEIT